MGDVAKIVFLGEGGHSDNATVRVSKARRNSVDVRVPAKATSGRLRAVNADGARSAASRAIVSVQRGGDGRVEGVAQPPGRYEFRVFAVGTAPATRPSAPSAAATSTRATTCSRAAARRWWRRAAAS